MQKVQNTSKPIVKGKHKPGFDFKNAFKDFSTNLKKELFDLKISLKKSHADNKALREINVKQTATTKSLQEVIVNKDEQKEKQQKNLEILKEEVKSLKLHYRELNTKYITLEKTYDGNMLVQKIEIEKLQKDTTKYEAKEFQLMNELVSNQKQSQLQLNAKTTECLELNEKILQLQNDIETSKNLEQTVKSYEIKLSSYEQDLESLDKYKKETEELKLQLKLKQEFFEKYQQEQIENEKTKQRTIDEQSFKIREIERVVEQRVKSVQPTTATPEETSPEIIQVVQHVEPEQNLNLSTSTLIRHVDNTTNTIQQNITRQQISQVRVPQNRNTGHVLTHIVDANNDISSASTTATTIITNQVENRTRAENRYSPVNSVFSSDDESVLSLWRPPILHQNSETSEAPRGFNISKRPHNKTNKSYSYVGDTSESDNANRPKRVKM